MKEALPLPSKQPDYRVNRSHSDFLINLRVPAATLKQALLRAWDAGKPLAQIPLKQIAALAGEKYTLDEWNFKF